MPMRRTFTTIALLLAACSTPSASPPSKREPVVPRIEAGASTPYSATIGLVVKPSGITGGERSAPLLPLVNGRVAAANLRGGEHAFLMPAVQTMVRPGAGVDVALTIAVDPSIPYLTVARVLYSAGQAERSSMQFVVRRGELRGALPLSLPRFGGSTPQITIELTQHEITLHGPDGRFAPGCVEIATTPGPTLARTGPDSWVALSRCLAALHAGSPDDDAILLAADGDLPFGDVAQAFALARGIETGPLFTNVVLSIAPI